LLRENNRLRVESAQVAAKLVALQKLYGASELMAMELERHRAAASMFHPETVTKFMTALGRCRTLYFGKYHTPLLSARLMRVGVLAAGVFIGVVTATFVALACLDIEMEWDRVTRSIPYVRSME
jgi:hypothetical protein